MPKSFGFDDKSTYEFARLSALFTKNPEKQFSFKDIINETGLNTKKLSKMLKLLVSTHQVIHKDSKYMRKCSGPPPTSSQYEEFANIFSSDLPARIKAALLYPLFRNDSIFLYSIFFDYVIDPTTEQNFIHILKMMKSNYEFLFELLPEQERPEFIRALQGIIYRFCTFYMNELNSEINSVKNEFTKRQHLKNLGMLEDKKPTRSSHSTGSQPKSAKIKV